VNDVTVGGATAAPPQTPAAATANQYRGTIRSGTVALFVSVALVLWVVVVLWADDMGTMPGTMGMGVPEFLLMWALMMSAMMLPSVAPMALLYSRTIAGRNPVNQAQFALGYLVAWAVTGLAAYALAWTAGELVAEAPDAARVAAVVTFAAVGVYQLTPLKFRCLDHCRSPLAHMLHYASFRGPARHVAAGAHHGLYCLGCCWALMVLMVAFGVMNVWAMVALALVVAVEKLWRHGVAFARAAGAAALVLAAAVIVEPGIAPGLDAGGTMTMDDGPTAGDPMGGMGG
jgi:predicted metal-binding membrane protein